MPELKDTVVFPQSVTPLAIGQERSIKLIDDVVSGDRMLALVTAKDASIEAPGFDDIYRVGTVAVVHKMLLGQLVPSQALGEDGITVEGSRETVRTFFGYFEPRIAGPVKLVVR